MQKIPWNPYTHKTKTKTKKQVQQGQEIQVQYIKIPTVFLYTINEKSKNEKKEAIEFKIGPNKENIQELI